MMAIETVKLTKFGMMAKNHMQNHRPQLYSVLQKDGTLDEVLLQVQEETVGAMQAARLKLKETNPPPRTDSFMENWQYNQWLEDTAWEMVKDRTGRIAKQLYQNADIRIQGFEEALIPDNFFDVAISNCRL